MDSHIKRSGDARLVAYVSLGVVFNLEKSERISAIFSRQGNLWFGNHCCRASVASEQQQNQDLRKMYRREYEFSNLSLFTRMHRI